MLELEKANFTKQEAEPQKPEEEIIDEQSESLIGSESEMTPEEDDPVPVEL